MARHRSPRGKQGPQNHPTPASGRQLRAARRLAVPALCGTAVVGAVATGAVAAGQTTSFADTAANLAMHANPLTTGDAAERTAPPPAPEVSAPEPADGAAPEVQALAKGVARAEERARPEPVEQPAPPPEPDGSENEAESDSEPEDDASAGESCESSGFNGVASHVAEAGHHLQDKFGVDDVGGVASRPSNPDSDHPRGYALDFMVDSSTGDAVAAYAEENSEELGVSYILWQVEDHYDHVHISFEDEPGSGLPC
ncbi:MAG: hypothetical protein GEV09_04445 [Pseudonocardiaceae bacterium]|nr:hypothetical protein [Pseudonocardiaceae bacterium]